MLYSHQNDVNFLPKADTASVNLPACSAAPPGRILDKTLSPSAPGCPAAAPVDKDAPVGLGPNLMPPAVPWGCVWGAFPTCGTFVVGLDTSGCSALAGPA